MWVEALIYDFFISGGRLSLDSYRAQGDINTYLDEKLVRIYYVHRYKPKKETTLCNAVDTIIGNYGLDETEVREAVVEFIKTYPCIWHFRDEYEEELKLLNL